MSREYPGAVRLTYRRLKSAGGLSDLDLIEERIATLAVAVEENTSLARRLAAVLDRVEASLVPLLGARHAGDAEGEVPGHPVAETVNHDIAPSATDQ